MVAYKYKLIMGSIGVEALQNNEVVVEIPNNEKKYSVLAQLRNLQRTGLFEVIELDGENGNGKKKYLVRKRYKTKIVLIRRLKDGRFYVQFWVGGKENGS